MRNRVLGTSLVVILASGVLGGLASCQTAMLSDGPQSDSEPPRWQSKRNPSAFGVLFSGLLNGSRESDLYRYIDGRVERLSAMPGHELDPAWAADGNAIVVSVWDEIARAYRTSRTKLVVLNAGGAEIEHRTESGWISGPTWTADMKAIVFGIEEGEGLKPRSFRLRRVDIDLRNDPVSDQSTGLFAEALQSFGDGAYPAHVQDDLYISTFVRPAFGSSVLQLVDTAERSRQTLTGSGCGMAAINQSNGLVAWGVRETDGRRTLRVGRLRLDEPHIELEPLATLHHEDADLLGAVWAADGVSIWCTKLQDVMEQDVMEQAVIEQDEMAGGATDEAAPLKHIIRIDATTGVELERIPFDGDAWTRGFKPR